MVFFKCIFEDVLWIEKNKEHINEGVIIFCDSVLKEPKCVKFENLLLSKTSFLRTDVRDIVIIEESEKILDDYLLELINKKIEIDNDEKKIGEIIKEIFSDRCEQDRRNQLLEKIINQIKMDNRERDDFVRFSDDSPYNDFIKILHKILPYLEEKTVLKEYSDLRKSFENSRTYVEASELFIHEMDLLRKTTMPKYEKYKAYVRISILLIPLILMATIFFDLCIPKIILILMILAWFIVILCFLEGIAFDIYKITSNYGESITRPVIISLIFVLFVSPILLPYIDLKLKAFTDSIGLYIYNILPESLKTTILQYDKLLEQTLRAFFQLRMDKTVINSTNNTIQRGQLQTLASYEWLIRVISLILLGSLFIAIKRRLERK